MKKLIGTFKVARAYWRGSSILTTCRVTGGHITVTGSGLVVEDCFFDGAQLDCNNGVTYGGTFDSTQLDPPRDNGVTDGGHISGNTTINGSLQA